MTDSSKWFLNEGAAMTNVASVTFATAGWSRTGDADGLRAWSNDAGDELSLHYFDKPPDLAAPLSDIDAIRDGYRVMIASASGTLVEVSSGHLAGVESLRTIVKIPQQPHGMTYIGSWTIPKKTFSFVIKVCCAEHGFTGARENLLLWKSLMGQSGSDPLSFDNEQWDAEFPNHPLSRVRATLRQIENTCVLGNEVCDAEPFGVPSNRRPARRWWHWLTGR
jgi:hypothetical protein